MIQEAHIGLGIFGKEGRQAVLTSDYAFARFKYLQRALLLHGHYYYMRLSTLVLYFFYKARAFLSAWLHPPLHFLAPLIPEYCFYRSGVLLHVLLRLHWHRMSYTLYLIIYMFVKMHSYWQFKNN